MADRYFQHVDGGIYRLVDFARSAADGGDVVVYEHLWPFDPGLWVRERGEFETRFSEIDAALATERMRGDRQAAQSAVAAAKAARRARAAKTT